MWRLQDLKTKAVTKDQVRAALWREVGMDIRTEVKYISLLMRLKWLKRVNKGLYHITDTAGW